MKGILHRVATATLTLPTKQDWLQSVGLLGIHALIYLPIGFGMGFLHVQVQSDWRTIVGVLTATFFMPGVLEELLFRVLLIPHPTENHAKSVRYFWIALSWLLFLIYHLPPYTPDFFKTPAFLLGAGSLGAVCTLSYLKSGSLWTSAVIHWLVVAVWLLVLGGLEKFQN